MRDGGAAAGTRRWFPGGWLVPWVLGAAVLAVGRVSANDQDLPERLKRVEGDLAETREAVEIAETRETSLLGEIERLDQMLEERRQELASVEEDLARVLRDERSARERVQTLEAEVTELRHAALERLRALHRLLLRGWGPVLLHAPGDLADALRYQRYLSAILEADRKLLGLLSERRREAARARNEAKEAARELGAVRSRREEGLREVRAAIEEKRALLASVRNEASRRQTMVRELEATGERLRKELARARAAPGEGGAPAEFVAPVAVSGVKLRDARNGVEIRADEGATIRAVADGRVVFADWFPGYGRMVILEHGGHLHSVYGYAGAVRVSRGDRVRQGDPIAEVGSTGAAREPALYLEIRERGQPKDPGNYISLR